MLSLLLFIIFLAFLFLNFYYSLPIWIKHKKLRHDYRDILSLPISPIPFVGNIHQFDKRQHVFTRLLVQMGKQCQQNNGLFCLWYSVWPMIFACTGESLASFINNSKQLVKSSDYKFLEPWLKTGLLTSNNAKWRSRRRLITPSFHDTQLLHNFMITFDEQSCIFAQRLDESIKNGEMRNGCDLYPFISACTLDVISETAMGEHFGAQLSKGKNEFVEATGRIGWIVNTRIRSPWLWPDFIFNRLPLGREHEQQLKILHGASRRIIEKRIAAFNSENKSDYDGERSKTRRVFIDSLIEQMNSAQLTIDDIQEEVDTFMFEGHDTTAAALNFTCYLLGCYPEVQSKVHAEMDAIFNGDNERPCTMEDTQEMPYLDAVIKEAMRVMPAVPFVMREAQEDFACCGQTIRKGTTVYIFIHAVHYDPKVFPEPERFDPDRFYENSVINEERSPFAFVPFSAGSRNCIGQRFALLEEKVILTALLRRFSFRSTQTIDELELSFEAIMRPTNPIKMIVERRNIQ